MEIEAPPSPRRAVWLQSGPIRLGLMMALTLTVIVGSLLGAVRATEAESARAEPQSAEPLERPEAASRDERPDEESADEPIALTPLVVADPSPQAVAEVALVEAAVVAVEQADAAGNTCVLQGDEPANEDPSATEDEGRIWYYDAFATLRPEWRMLAGTWSVEDGAFVQSNLDGYDLLAEVAVPIPDAARISVDLTARGAALGGGLMIGQPTAMLRNGAVVVDFTDEGRFLRWGSYDETSGAYAYLGGVSMPSDFDALATHNLAVELRPDRSTVFVDDVLVGVFRTVGSGQLGLVTSASSVAFDNLTVRELLSEGLVEATTDGL